jgi:hypothetical protein
LEFGIWNLPFGAFLETFVTKKLPFVEDIAPLTDLTQRMLCGRVR